MAAGGTGEILSTQVWLIRFFVLEARIMGVADCGAGIIEAMYSSERDVF